MTVKQEIQKIISDTVTSEITRIINIPGIEKLIKVESVPATNDIVSLISNKIDERKKRYDPDHVRLRLKGMDEVKEIINE